MILAQYPLVAVLWTILVVGVFIYVIVCQAGRFSEPQAQRTLTEEELEARKRRGSGR